MIDFCNICGMPEIKYTFIILYLIYNNYYYTYVIRNEFKGAKRVLPTAHLHGYTI